MSGGRPGRDAAVDAATSAEVDYAALFEAITTPCLVVNRDLRIVTLNAAYEQMTGCRREQLQGLHLLEAFSGLTPRPPEQGSELEESLARVLASGRPDALPVYRYDLPDAAGEVRERWWSALNLPVLDADGEVTLILRRVDEVSTSVHPPLDAVADIHRRGQELHAALDAEAATSRRLQALVQVALQMGTAQSTAELTEVVVGAGASVLGADDGAVAVLTEDGQQLELSFSASVDEEMRRTYPLLPLAARLPVSLATATGEPVVLADERTCRAWSPELGAAIDLGGYRATVGLPLRSGGQVLGALSISWHQEQVFERRDLDLMNALAAHCAQTLQRISLQEQERRIAAEARGLSESLQRSLLTHSIQPDHLQIAVRYLPAAARAEIGGDWYDSFLLPTGALTLVIGDVAGHDRDAAASMAQVRNLLRGVSCTLQGPPAAVLSRLDETMQVLGVGALTTAVLAQVEQTPEQAGAGLRRLRWSNAGHCPPVLLDPDGTARLLETEPDLFLGLDSGTDRFDHVVDLQPHTTVVFYTDGLVERRHACLQEGLEWLRATVEGHPGLSAEALCELVLAGLAEQEDDIALLVLHTLPDDAPRTDPSTAARSPGDVGKGVHRSNTCANMVSGRPVGVGKLRSADPSSER